MTCGKLIVRATVHVGLREDLPCSRGDDQAPRMTDCRMHILRCSVPTPGRVMCLRMYLSQSVRNYPGASGVLV